MDTVANRVVDEKTAFERAIIASNEMLAHVESGFEALGLLCMFFAMCLVSADTVGRYAFNAPIRWATESLTMYLLPGMFFFGLGISISRRVHVCLLYTSDAADE